MEKSLPHQNIEKLPSDVIDQIAAGEVVERPSQMVKELIENSIDAEAQSIEIEVEEGGRTLKIIDDGSGIIKDQLPLALSRHATSKIRKTDDLWKLSSFGFRGEALASVAAVSNLSITSKTASSKKAFRLTSEFGALNQVEEVGGAQGTTITVDRLFENVPARMKFLRTDSGEVGHIKMVIKAMALSNPEVAFKLKIKGKLVFMWPAVSHFCERVGQVLDVKPVFEAYGEVEGYKAQIAFAPPNVTFGNSRNIWLFAQGRWIQDRSLQAAVMEAYRGLLMHGEFPYAVVWLTCPSEHIDVNVHPAKSQVKFHDQRTAFRAVQRGLRAELEKAPWVEKVLKEKTGSDFFSNEARSSFQLKEQTSEPQNLKFDDSSFEKISYPQKSFASSENYSSGGHSQVVQSTVTQYSKNHFKNSALADEATSSKEPRWSQLHLIGQAHLTYLVAQSDTKILFIDQHAAHERVAYEKLMAAWKNEKIEVQNYLIPLSLDFSEEEVEGLISFKDELLRMGLEIDPGGPTTVVIRSGVTFIKEGSVAKALARLAHEIVERGGSFAFEKSVSDVFATMACHSVVRAGQSMSFEQMQSLLVEMDQFPLSSFCPHGRPVYVEYPIDRLEKDFGRIV